MKENVNVVVVLYSRHELSVPIHNHNNNNIMKFMYRQDYDRKTIGRFAYFLLSFDFILPSAFLARSRHFTVTSFL